MPVPGGVACIAPAGGCAKSGSQAPKQTRSVRERYRKRQLSGPAFARTLEGLTPTLAALSNVPVHWSSEAGANEAAIALEGQRTKAAHTKATPKTTSAARLRTILSDAGGVVVMRVPIGAIISLQQLADFIHRRVDMTVDYLMIIPRQRFHLIPGNFQSP